MNTQTQMMIADIHGNAPRRQTSFSKAGTKSLQRYAWLECESDLWHFLASPFANPAESTRKWPDKQEALDELENEGWKVVRPYPERFCENSDSNYFGYGLQRIIN
jgi:hypothetical protein